MNNSVIVKPAVLQDGQLRISGFKHLLVGVVCACICYPDQLFIIDNVPDILETKVLSNIICRLGGECHRTDQALVVSTKHITTSVLDTLLTKQINGALYLLPTILFRCGHVCIGATGGCQIGNQTITGRRPIHHKLDILQRFGAHFSWSDHVIEGWLTRPHTVNIDIMDYSDRQDSLTGPLVSGATKTAILAAMNIVDNECIIKNPYMKPDVTELLAFLTQLGHDIDINETRIRLRAKRITRQSLRFSLLADVSQIMTAITLAVYCDIDVTIKPIEVSKVKLGLYHEFAILKAMNVKLIFADDYIRVPKQHSLHCCDINVSSTGIYSDHQPLFALLLTMANAPSVIREYVWKQRFSYVSELEKMGLCFDLNDSEITILPSQTNQAAEVTATDLRAAATLLIAALNNPQITTVHGLHHLHRGYDNLLGDVLSLGANLETL